MNNNYTFLYSWIIYYLGGVDGLLLALAIFIIVEFITSIMCIIVNKKLCKINFSHEICKKVVIILLIGIANILDKEIMGTGAILRTAVIFFYLANEGKSILENTVQLGVPIPNKLKIFFDQLPNNEKLTEKE